MSEDKGVILLSLRILKGITKKGLTTCSPFPKGKSAKQ